MTARVVDHPLCRAAALHQSNEDRVLSFSGRERRLRAGSRRPRLTTWLPLHLYSTSTCEDCSRCERAESASNSCRPQKPEPVRASCPPVASAPTTSLGRIATALPPDNVVATPPPPAMIAPGASVRSMLPNRCRQKKPKPVRTSHVALLCHGTIVYLCQSESDKESDRSEGSGATPAACTLGGFAMWLN